MIYPNLGFGMGLRYPHYDEVISSHPKTVDWFEIISENFIDAHEGYIEFLRGVRLNYPILMHGVSLNIGSTDALDIEYLKKLKALVKHLNPPFISDHLCWTGVNAHNTHDLLPLPYTKHMLSHLISRIRYVQDFIEVPFILENPSTYIEFNESTMDESTFITHLLDEADCGMLLDVNNVYVSAFNHGFDAMAYIDAIPSNRIAQLHLAGHLDYGTHIIDTHDRKVREEVWTLYAYTINTKGVKSTLIEWDENIPSFEEVVTEVSKARTISCQKGI
jgi:uncharacterized protein